MARLSRVNPEDGIHHVNNHVVGDGNLFHDDRDRRVFLRLVEEARAEYEVHVLGYCLMGNHYHLVVLCPRANLDRFMQHFQSRYARYYNKRYARRGTLFEARYHSNLVTTDGQLQFTLRYVDRNPLELGIDIGSYRWGSYGSFGGSRSARNELVTIDQRWTLAFAGSHAGYRQFVEQDVEHDPFRHRDGIRRVDAVDDVTAAESIRALIRTVASLSGQSPEQVTSSTNGPTTDARLLAFVVAADSEFAVEEVMAELGCRARSTYWGIVARAQRRRNESTKFAALADEIASQWSRKIDAAARRRLGSELV